MEDNRLSQEQAEVSDKWGLVKLLEVKIKNLPASVTRGEKFNATMELRLKEGYAASEEDIKTLWQLAQENGSFNVELYEVFRSWKPGPSVMRNLSLDERGFRTILMGGAYTTTLFNGQGVCINSSDNYRLFCRFKNSSDDTNPETKIDFNRQPDGLVNVNEAPRAGHFPQKGF